MAHGDAVVDGDGVEFLGHAAGLLDLAGDQLAEVLQVHVAGHELGEGVAMAIGFLKSSSFIPVARQRARAPAMSWPWVEVFER
ncbi:hypothetical protein P4233_06965 [Pseudomonas aeruginosa]|nr:hypothetical protein [Pseudomonas aeruginosa]